MAAPAGSLSDGEYRQLWSSLQQQENHVCTRQCQFKQVFGNMYYCTSSGQAHVCDQNCTQRIFYDNHHDICRLSRRIFPRVEAPMEAAFRKRGGDEAMLLAATKRPQPGAWPHQQALQEQPMLAVASPRQQCVVGDVWQQPQAHPALHQGWAC